MLDQELINCFLDEVEDLLVEWERSCLALDDEEVSPETFSALFRAAHNMKGTSRAVGLEDFGSFIHKVEDLIQQIMNGTTTLNGEIVSVFFDVQNVLIEWVSGLRSNIGFVADTSQIGARVKNILAGEVANDCLASQSVSCHATTAPEEDSRANQVRATRSSDELELEELFNLAREAYEQQQGEAVADTSQVPLAKNFEDKTTKVEKSTPIDNNSAQKIRAVDETIRISAGKLDALIQLVGELAIHNSIINEANKQKKLDTRVSQNALALSSKITRELQNQALSLRMQPVQGLLQRLERAIKDVARAQGKQVNVMSSGSEVELDKMVLEKITDPLIHIVRNAVDHGLEDSETRRINKKTDKATIWIGAIQDAGGVTIEIRDNGKGIDTEKVLEKAKAKQLVQSRSELTEQEIYMLLFQPGFSTAEKVTDISGRGVGMDIVLKAVQALNGRIQVDSTLGQGTSFAINLPTSLSIIDALIVEICQVKYAVPMQEILEIIDLSNYNVEPSSNTGQMLSLRGQVLPLFNLKDYMPNPVKAGNSLEAKLSNNPALIVKSSNKYIALRIDSILTQQQVVVRQLTRQFTQFKIFGGSTILGDGEPGMIINLPEVSRNCLSKFSARSDGLKVEADDLNGGSNEHLH